MPVSIIESFQLGTDLPLDARYIVGNPYDVSLYWYNGMQIYEASSGKLYVVTDSSLEIIEDVLYRAEFDASYGSIDSSIIDLYNLTSDLSLYVDSIIPYVDGSLAFRDASLNALFIENDIQDASIIRIDTSLGQLNNWISQLDSSIIRIDGSINLLFLENDIQDASIIRIDASIVNLYNTKVNRSGDTMTGKLTVPLLDVTGDVSLNQKIHFTEYTNSVPENGDLWVDPSGCINFAYEVTGLCASSYNLQNRLLRTENDWISFPDSSTLDPGDRILIEDAQDSYKKKWISAEAFAQAASQLLYAAYDDAKAIQSTTSTTYVNALTLITDASAIASSYRVGWTIQVANSKNGKASNYRVQIDGTIILEDETVTAIASNSYSSFSGFEYVSLGAGSHTITVDYHASPGSTAYVQYVRLEFRKADVET